MPENQEIDKSLDCYGYLYNEFLAPCRDKCAARFLCKDEIRKRLEIHGQDEFEKEQRRIIMANEQEVKADLERKSGSDSRLEPTVSPLVSEILAICGNLGLRVVHRKGHIAIKELNRNIFGLTRSKAEDLNNLLKFIPPKDRTEFPESILSMVSTLKVGGFWTAVVSNMSDVETVIKTYYEFVRRKES